jgi:predicted PilT family ATPase
LHSYGCWEKFFEKIVPDTSIIIEGVLSSMIEQEELDVKAIIYMRLFLTELESQANKNKEQVILVWTKSKSLEK